MYIDDPQFRIQDKIINLFNFTLGYFPGESKRKKGHKVNYMQIWKPGVHSCRVSTDKNPHAQPWHWIHSVLVSCL